MSKSFRAKIASLLIVHQWGAASLAFGDSSGDSRPALCAVQEACMITHEMLESVPDGHSDFGLTFEARILTNPDGTPVMTKIGYPYVVFPITSIAPTGVAHLFSDIKVGDVLININGYHFQSLADINKAIRAFPQYVSVKLALADILYMGMQNGKVTSMTSNYRHISIFSGEENAAYAKLGTMPIKENNERATLPDGRKVITATVLGHPEAPIKTGDVIFSIDGDYFDSVDAMQQRLLEPYSFLKEGIVKVGYFSVGNHNKAMIATYGQARDSKFVEHIEMALFFGFICYGLAAAATEVTPVMSLGADQAAMSFGEEMAIRRATAALPALVP